MCGIAGILGGGDGRRDVIKHMTDTIVHRGPDDSGFFYDDDIALGQRRLSIIDLETGRQPITNQTEDVVLICNGEIYNSPDLRKSLEDKGYRFKTATDVETVLHLYEEFGEKCVDHLQGMFAFVIWDQRHKKLILARDHLGQKPLYFFQGNGVFCFASEVKALLATPWIEPGADLEAIWHYVSMRFVPDELSFFKGIRKLPAAHVLVWQNGTSRVERYWELRFGHKHPGTDEQIIDGLHDVIDESVRSHLLSDVRVGAFLSGGIDSSTIAAMMAHHTDNGPVPVFSIGVKEQSFNELPYARMVVERYGLEGHEKVVSADMIHLIPKMISHMDEPSDPYGVGVYLVSRLARETVKVVLSGDGGDENFAGYDRYAGQRYADIYAILPRWLRAHVMSRLVRLVPESFGYKTLAQKARWLNDVSLYERGHRYAYSLSFLRFTQEMKHSLFTRPAIDNIEVENSDRKILDYFDAGNADDLVDRMLYTDLMTRMPDHLMVIADRMTMAHSLESRAPLLDHRLTEYAAAMPGRLKLKGSRLKHGLKEVAGRYLPGELIDRSKQGFGFPIARWMRTDLAQLLRNLFKQSRFVEQGWFEQSAIDTLLDEHLSGTTDHNFRLWILLNLEFWYRQYFEGMSVDDMQDFTASLMQD